MNVEKIIKTDKKIPLPKRTIIHLFLVHNKTNEMFAKALKPFEISQQQFNVLRILRGQQGKPANLSTINDRMVSKMSNTTRLVDKLICRGHVERMVCEANRRKVEITITQQGLDALSEMDKEMANTEKQVLQRFSHKELEQLNKLLDKF
ncbi:MarR family winged helix-turn-helix transcriptional regulator [Spongiimicrobium sp. 3-5]|uniref:MarR family winged helix-turn-helix transcriptional regulator n=1 Tax=Spongiimicrobium sp. 3-5 TaxID=3332596 RepID=UPI00397F0F30